MIGLVAETDLVTEKRGNKLMLNQYLESLQEGYIFSDKTISINLDDFEKGTISTLFIIGNSGSGKTTLTNHLSKKYKTEVVYTDNDFRDINNLVKNSKRIIIEGVDLLWFYPKNKQLMLNQSMIIFGTSALKGAIKAAIRNKEDGMPWKRMIKLFKINFQNIEKRLKVLRKDVVKMPNIDIKEFTVPKL
jgi:Cdc6-like AAA superfamily ATPase